MPVVILTSFTALIYVAALVLPLLYDCCPYGTALSKLVKPYPGTWSRKRESQPDFDVSSDKVPMDIVTSRTLGWMISNSEVPASVDLALQAIAGTTFEMPNEALDVFKAADAVSSRLASCLEDSEDVTVEQLTMLKSSEPATFASVLAYAQSLNLMVAERRELSPAHPSAGYRSEDEASAISLLESLHFRYVVLEPIDDQRV